MRLFHKIGSTLFAASLAGTVASAIAVNSVFVPQFLEMDRAAAAANASLVFEALQNDRETAATFVHDWGHWDETFEFSNNLNKGYIQRNLKQVDLETILVDEFVVARLDGKIAYSLRTDRSKDAAPVPFAGLTAIPALHWRSLDAAAKSNNGVTKEVHSGFANTLAGPAMLSMIPITDSNYRGPVSAVLVFVRLIDKEVLQAVRDKTDLEFDLRPAMPGYSPHGKSIQIGRHGRTLGSIVSWSDHLDVDVVLKDINGKPGYILSVKTPARFAALAAATMWVVIGILASISVLGGAVLAVFMKRVVTAPLETIMDHAKTIAATGNLDKRLGLTRTDEIGLLAQSYDDMIGQLRQARLQLQEMSFVSGMANAAADILHNVRNSLSPVTTATWKGRESLKELRTDRLAAAGAALSEPDAGEDRKSKLAVYVTQCAKHIEERCQAATAEFNTIHTFTSQIEAVLASHDEQSRGVRHVETVSLKEIVEAAAALTVSESGPEIDVRISPALDSVAHIFVQRIVLRQVIDNLVVNAVQAIERHKPSRGLIEFDGRDSGDHVELTITDNGQGIDQSHLGHLFTRGFTLRQGSGQGLGLHFCATSLQAMGSTIAVESEGAGRGACFSLRFPSAVKSGIAA
ncbi:MAG: CHASE4 domain-containing protein [Alphaproteobacteria bacterium]|nr:CHASE4 domain-containing protein [Alphaproteobacteria bacterium]